MKEFEAKYRTVIDVAKTVFAKVSQLTFCGGTALNTFYLDYRYSEDLDIGYQNKNPKSDIEEVLQQHGYEVARTGIKIRDIVRSGTVEIKMDVFEYVPTLGLRKAELEGIVFTIPTRDEFMVSKMISFLTREELSGLTRDAYDLYMLNKIDGRLLQKIRKHRAAIMKRIVSTSYNFQVLEERSEEADLSVVYLLKNPIEHDEVLEFMAKLRTIMVKT
jgi:hypothetical protein